MNLALVGVSHHRAPIELRERAAVDLGRAGEMARTLGDGLEVVVLSTCNRTELYVAGDQETRELEDRATSALLGLAGDAAADLHAVLYRLGDDAAALHLFRVAAGLDSLVPGEGEILGQVRSAFDVGAPGMLLDRLFRQALHAGRRVRVETAIGESPASVPAAAGALAKQIFGDLSDRRVLLVGAGRTSELAARNLESRGATIAAVANRTESRGEALARRLDTQAIGLDRIIEQLTLVDIVVCSTSAPGLVLDAVAAADAIRARRGRPLLLIDLAVPRDVDTALAALDGCFVYDVDDLGAVVDVSLAGRRAEAGRAERIVTAEAGRFNEWHSSLSVVPAIASLRERAESIRVAELLRATGRLEDLSERERHVIEVMTTQIVNKLLHLPTVRMKEAAAGADGVVYADVVRHLFGLGEGDRP